MEFDIETLSPTYELSIGLPGRSNALIIAKRLGLNPVIVEKAESIVRPDALQADSLLDDIKRAKQEAQQVTARAKERERQAQLVEADLRHQLAQIEEARRTVIAEARTTMQHELEEVRREIDQTRRQLTRATQFGASPGSHEQFLAEAEKEVTRRQRSTEDVDTRVVRPSGDQMSGPIEVGDRVWVPTLQASGEVLSLNDRAGDAEVQIGNFRLKLPVKRLELRQKAVRDEATAAYQCRLAGGMVDSPGIEFDMRGERVEEGLPRLERYLDNAYMARLPWVRIIHGKGTGVLRDAVRTLLRQHPSVAEFRNGESGEGGDGVTVAKMVSN